MKILNWVRNSPKSPAYYSASLHFKCIFVFSQAPRLVNLGRATPSVRRRNENRFQDRVLSHQAQFLCPTEMVGSVDTFVSNLENKSSTFSWFYSQKAPCPRPCWHRMWRCLSIWAPSQWAPPKATSHAHGTPSQLYRFSMLPIPV